jgi:hypothetical protein
MPLFRLFSPRLTPRLMTAPHQLSASVYSVTSIIHISMLSSPSTTWGLAVNKGPEYVSVAKDLGTCRRWQWTWVLAGEKRNWDLTVTKDVGTWRWQRTLGLDGDKGPWDLPVTKDFGTCRRWQRTWILAAGDKEPGNLPVTRAPPHELNPGIASP